MKIEKWPITYYFFNLFFFKFYDNFTYMSNNYVLPVVSIGVDGMRMAYTEMNIW